MSAFLTLTYIVFASVSTVVFDTFNCMKIGDDPTKYLVRDQSIDCSSPSHRTFKYYASVMIFVYPLGIPGMYFVMLYIQRKKLRAKDRDFDPTIQKTGFLWENYERHMWWWEVAECGRRLSLSGVLVFVDQGSASQIIVALVIAFFTSGFYIHLRPFERESDDDLAIVTQVSLFFTLFAALLKKVQIDETENYNQVVFGMLLIIVNCMGVIMILLAAIAKPVRFFTDSLWGEQQKVRACESRSEMSSADTSPLPIPPPFLTS